MKLLLVLFVLFQSHLYAQRNEQSICVGLGSGIRAMSVKDISASPLAYSGFGLPIDLHAFMQREKEFYALRIEMIDRLFTNNYPLQSTVQTKLSTWSFVQSSFIYARNIPETTHYVGAALNMEYFYREYDFLDGQNFEQLTSLGLIWRKEILRKKSFRCHSTFSLPMISYVLRKPSLTLDEQFVEDYLENKSLIRYGKVRSIFWNWIQFSGSLSAQYSVSSKWRVGAEVGIMYYQIQFPEKVQTINYPILCHVYYSF